MLNIKIPESPREDRGTIRLNVQINKNLTGNVIKSVIKNAGSQTISLAANVSTVSNANPKKLNTQEQAIEAKYDLDDEALFEIY